MNKFEIRYFTYLPHKGGGGLAKGLFILSERVACMPRCDKLKNAEHILINYILGKKKTEKSLNIVDLKKLVYN